MAKVVFLGTPQFAVPVLRALASVHEVLWVVTQPDQIAGRGRRQLFVPAVKLVAEELGLRVLQPLSLRRDHETLQILCAAQPDVLVLAAYGQILRPPVLALAPHGCIGVHASLLPQLRGAAPVATAILQGLEETGITLMLTDAGMDTGPIIAQHHLSIAPTDNTEALTVRLAHLGATLLLETLPDWLSGQIAPQPQDQALATYAPPLQKAQGLLVWNCSAIELDRQIRACTPWPGAFTYLRDTVLKVLVAHSLPLWPHTDPPGTVVETAMGLGVTTGAGLLLLDQVQLAGRKPTEACAFARGRRGFVGSVLGT